MKSNHLVPAICLLILIVSVFPASDVGALAAATPPPADMFQLPWDLGFAWVAFVGIDNGSKRPLNSSHNYHLGGAIDFAPKAKMVTGEDTSKYWVTAAAAGTVIQTSGCDLTIVHADGWITQYQFLGNIQVKLGDVVARNQRLAIIADGVRQKYCPGYSEINVPHLHFVLRPSILDATFAGWQVKYNSVLNITTFNKGLIILGLYKPLLNVMEAPTPTPTATATSTPTSTPTQVVTPTPTITGPYVSTTIDPRNIEISGTALVTVRLNNVPSEGYTSAEFTCSYA
ncbi:MAG: M23 family metallopeptidase, partial [Byssovorax cruenta]